MFGIMNKLKVVSISIAIKKAIMNRHFVFNYIVSNDTNAFFQDLTPSLMFFSIVLCSCEFFISIENFIDVSKLFSFVIR